MAESYQEEQLRRTTQGDLRTHERGTASGVRPGKIFRAGTFTATANAAFWDIEVLTDKFERMDLNSGGRYNTVKAVRPVLTNVAVSSSGDVAVDDIVMINLGSGQPVAQAPVLEAGSGDDDYLLTEGSGAYVMVSGSSCSLGLTAFGIITD